jgi:hypothetical protein
VTNERLLFEVGLGLREADKAVREAWANQALRAETAKQMVRGCRRALANAQELEARTQQKREAKREP